MILRMKIPQFRRLVIDEGLKPEDARTLKRKVKAGDIAGTVEGGGTNKDGVKKREDVRIYVDSVTKVPTWPAQAAAAAVQAKSPLARALLSRNAG